MPYANNSAFARQMRAYVSRRRLKGVSRETYLAWLKTCGELLEWKHPKEITVRDLEDLESRMMAMGYAETSVSNYMDVMVAMLKRAKNQWVEEYEKLCSPQPDQHPVWLTGEQLAEGRMRARSLSVTHELIYSLMGDNGLRPVDVSRLTMQNAKELLRTGKSVILGKGRGEGKKGLLILSPLTRKPMQEYLALRRTFPGADAMETLLIYEYRKQTVPIPVDTMARWIKEILQSTGIDASAKDLRKTFLNMVYRETGDEWLTARMARHTKPGTSFRHYIGAMEERQTDVLSKLAEKCPEWSSQSDRTG